MLCITNHVTGFCVTVLKMFKYGVFFWSLFSCIQSKYGKTRTRKNIMFGHFLRGMSIDLKCSIITAAKGGFITLHVWKAEVRKHLTILEGCYFTRFCLLTSSNFRKIEAKNFTSDPYFWILLNWDQYHQSQTIEAEEKVFKILSWKLTNMGSNHSGIFWKVGSET